MTPLGRREVLSVSGAAALAALSGCSGRLLSDSQPTIPRDDLLAATDGDLPTVPETLPVDVEASFVDAQRAIARSMLDGTPAPFDETEIPNGVIRERVNGAYDDASRAIRDASRDASGAPTPYERLEHAAGARGDARELAAAWAAIEDDLTVADLRESIPDVSDGVDAFAAAHTYVGDDPVRTAVVHDEIEERIHGARRWLSVRDREFATAAENALDLAEIAADVERARVDVTVASYLLDRFRRSLDDPADQRARLTGARAELNGRIAGRATSMSADVPDDPTALVDRDVETTAGVYALEELASDARSRIEDLRTGRDSSGPAGGVVDGTMTLTHLLAFERLRDRIEGGDDVAVDTAADVADLRSDAVAAVEASSDVERGGLLVDVYRPQVAGEIQRVDRRLGNGPDDIRVDSVARDAAGYVRIAAVCSVLPTAADTVAGILHGSTR